MLSTTTSSSSSAAAPPLELWQTPTDGQTNKNFGLKLNENAGVRFVSACSLMATCCIDVVTTAAGVFFFFKKLYFFQKTTFSCGGLRSTPDQTSQPNTNQQNSQPVRQATNQPESHQQPTSQPASICKAKLISSWHLNSQYGLGVHSDRLINKKLSSRGKTFQKIQKLE